MAVCVHVCFSVYMYSAAIVLTTVLFGTAADNVTHPYGSSFVMHCKLQHADFLPPLHALQWFTCSSFLGCHVGTCGNHSYFQRHFSCKPWLPELQLGACWQRPLLVDKSVNDTGTFCILVGVQ